MMNLYDKCYVIGHWEIDNGIPEEDCITNWFGDYNMFEPKIGVKEAEVDKKYEEIMKGGNA